MADDDSHHVEIPFTNYVFNIPYHCEYLSSSLTSGGLFRKGGRYPFMYSIPLFMAQYGLVALVSGMFRYLLRPLRQPTFVADMLTGIIVGPTIFQQIYNEENYNRLFLGKQSIIADVLEVMSFCYIIFLIGVRTDLTVIKTSGKLAWVIGTASFLIPVTMSVSAVKLLGLTDPNMNRMLDSVATMESTTSLHVTFVILNDLKLLNSEIGRLALSSSFISNLLGLSYKSIRNSQQQFTLLQMGALEVVPAEICRILLILFVVFVLRPIMFRMMKRIPEGRPIKESHFMVMNTMFVAIAFVAEYVGLQAHFGVLVLGLAVPTGPPLGSGITERLGVFVTALLLPAYIMNAGRVVNTSLLSTKTTFTVEVLIFVAYFGKVAAAAVPARLSRMPFSDALSLGLILSAQGFFDIMIFKRSFGYLMINQEMYTMLTISAVLYAAIFTPLVSYLYDPSKRYVNYRRRTIQHARRDTELRILFCITEEELVSGALNLLRATYSARDRPLGVYVLDLIELVGRDVPILINHQFHLRRSSNATRNDRVINAFKHYELRNQGTVRNQFFTSITTYATMHDDVCTLALEKSTSIMIIPFQKSDDKSVKAVTKNVLNKAPCSVGILVDRKILTNFVSDNLSQSTIRVCVIFTGGPDSREALAYGVRMAENPRTRLTVIRIFAEDEFVSDLMAAKLDLKAITDFRSGCKESENDRIEYHEVGVSDGAETYKVLLSLDEGYDFVLVGRRIDEESPLLAGIAEWESEHNEELGIIGDIVSSSDMKGNASVLVLQQQSTVEDLMKKFG